MRKLNFLKLRHLAILILTLYIGLSLAQLRLRRGIVTTQIDPGDAKSTRICCAHTHQTD